MYQMAKLKVLTSYTTLKIWKSAHSLLFLPLGIFPSYNFSSNSQEKIFRTFFCLCCSCTILYWNVTCVSVCTQRFSSLRPLALLLCRPNSLPRSPCSVPVLCLNMYLVFIRAPSMALLLYTSTLFAGWASLAGVV